MIYMIAAAVFLIEGLALLAKPEAEGDRRLGVAALIASWLCGELAEPFYFELINSI